MRRALAVTGMLVLLGAAPAPLTFADVVRRVTTAGFDYRLAMTMAIQADAAARSKVALTRPSIGLGASAVSENLPQFGTPVSRQVYVSATASVPIFVPAAVAAARSAAYLATGSGPTGDLANARDDAGLLAARAYRRAQLAQAILDARQVAVDDERRHVARTDEQIAVGHAPRYLAARDRAQLAMAEQAQEDAAAERDESQNDLAALLALPLDAPPAPVEPLTPIDFIADRDVYLKRALLQRADVAAAHARFLSAEQTVAAYRAAFSPTLALNAQSYNGGSAPYLGHGGASLALTANVPIVDGGSRHADIANAIAQFDQARITQERIASYAQRDVADAWREVEAARAAVGRSETTLHNSDEQLRVARLREGAGKAIDLEILDALSLTASAREERARSIARLDVAVAVLHRAAGDPQI